jgi:hypothetical protein
MNEFDETSDLYAQSRPTGRFDAEGREIRLLGREIFAWNPMMNNLAVPEEFQRSPLVKGCYFYTLPLDVIDAVVAVLGADRFGADLLHMERQLSEISGDHTCRVGFWQNNAIAYRELRSLPIEFFADDQVRDAGMSPAAVSHALRIYKERDLGALERFSRGFCGWLLTNRQFLDEHDALLGHHSETVKRWGTQSAATLLPEHYRANLIPGTDPNTDPLWPAFANDYNEFLLRWRLSGLAGPYLPIPAKPLMAGTFPISMIGQLMNAGGVFFLPDTMPIPSRDQLRGQLDNALHRDKGLDHLAEWLDIVRADNMARNRMDPFIRYLELQHYWRILHQRHASAIHRNTGSLEAVFGEILNVSTKQIHTDLIAIRRKLGSKWLHRPWPIRNEVEPMTSA